MESYIEAAITYSIYIFCRRIRHLGIISLYPVYIVFVAVCMLCKDKANLCFLFLWKKKKEPKHDNGILSSKFPIWICLLHNAVKKPSVCVKVGHYRNGKQTLFLAFCYQLLIMKPNENVMHLRNWILWTFYWGLYINVVALAENKEIDIDGFFLLFFLW